jgi:hypothetical protein
MAITEKVITVDPTSGLYTPKNAKACETRAMSIQEVQVALAGVEPREKVVMSMAIFAGFRPGEMLGLQRRHVAAGCSAAYVEQRVYRGVIDDPKTAGSVREAAIPPTSVSRAALRVATHPLFRR